MPITAITFWIGTLALCGVYGMSGFFSKDAILIAGGLGNMPIFYLLTLGAFMTAGYMGRLFWIAFLGQPNLIVHRTLKSPPAMLVPLIILASLSIVGGWMGYWPDFLGG